MKTIFIILLTIFLSIYASQDSDRNTLLGVTPLNVKGFKLFLFADSNRSSQLQAALSVLSENLTRLAKTTPSKQFDRLTAVPILLEYRLQTNSAMCYHKSKDWLIANSYPVEIAKCIEICNINNFLNWQKLNQPDMLLHELAHAYHDRILGFNHQETLFAYQNAVKSKKYENVAYNLGGRRRAYALNNVDEYFAELTEAYLGKNDYYPYNRTQLRIFDPKGYKLMQKIWD